MPGGLERNSSVGLPKEFNSALNGADFLSKDATTAARVVEQDRDESFGVGKITTPVDEITRQPLLIVPFEEATETSEHHPAHPGNSIFLTETKGGVAVRHARIQTVRGLGGTASMFQFYFNPEYNPGDHRLYHLHFGGPILPQTAHEQFEYVTWACTDFVPEKGISLRGDEPEIVELEPYQISRLQEQIRIQSPCLVGDFLIEYLKEQDLSHVPDSLIDEFVNSKNRERRRSIGHWLLSQASEVATDPLAGTYKKVRAKGQTNPVLSPKLADVVQMRLGGPRRRTNMVDEWRNSLVA